MIADLKNHLSEHLRVVRNGGEVIVMDRLTPIAKIVPLGNRTNKKKIGIIKPANPAEKIGQLKFEKVPGLTQEVLDAALEAERQDRN